MAKRKAWLEEGRWWNYGFGRIRAERGAADDARDIEWDPCAIGTCWECLAYADPEDPEKEPSSESA